MLFGILLIIQVVDQADDAPFFNILVKDPREVTHHGLYRKSMFDQAFALIIPEKELPGFFT